MSNKIRQWKDLRDEAFDSIRTSWGVGQGFPEYLIGEVKRQSALITCVAVACHAGTLGTKCRHYARAIPEALLLSTVMACHGVGNPQMVLLRQSIELALRYSYFTDHPVENELVQTSDNLRQFGYTFLSEYVKKHPRFAALPSAEIFAQRLNDVHSKTSRFVHVYNQSFYGFEKQAVSGRLLATAVRDQTAQFEALFPGLVAVVLCPRVGSRNKMSSLERRFVKQLFLPGYKDDAVALGL